MSRGKCPVCYGSGFEVETASSHLLKFCQCRTGQRMKQKSQAAVRGADREDRKFLIEYAGEQFGPDLTERDMWDGSK